MCYLVEMATYTKASQERGEANMKFVHLSDLHLGKRLKDYSLLEDQRIILEQIIGIVEKEKPQAVVIAGDIYDTAVPTVDAVELCDYFLTKLHECNVPVLVIAGNHDNAKRIAFGAGLLQSSDVYMSPVYNGKMNCVTIQDEYGPVHFYLMPFLRRSEIQYYHPEVEVRTYTEAIRTVVEAAGVNWTERNVVVSHQFVVGGQVSDGSGATFCLADEDRIGDVDRVERQAYNGFEYVALGHLHTPQHVGVPTVRYCGTPLKYSLSELWSNKSVTVVEMSAKGDEVQLRTIPLVPKHDARELKGTLQDLLDPEYDKGDHSDYISVVLTDEQDQFDAISYLRRLYPNILSVKPEKESQYAACARAIAEVKELAPADVFAKFYNEVVGKEMTAEQTQLIADILEEIQTQNNAQ